MSVPVRSRSLPATTPRRLGLALAGASALVVLAGCAGASSGTSTGEASVAPAPAAVPGTASDRSPVVTKDAASGAATADAALPQSLAVDRSVVVRADVGVRVDDVMKRTAALSALATGHDAVIASQSVSSGTGTTPDVPTAADGQPSCPSTGCPTTYASSTTTLRVDNDGVDALLKDVATLGTVETSTRTSDDVTADVADIDSRVRNAQASVARIRALMSQATRIGDVVTLEGELSKRQADLEALEARQRALADQTAQATVTVRLYAESAPAPAPQTGTGFLAGLRAGWESFTGFLAGALTVLGAVLPWLILVLPLALLGWTIARRRRESPAVDVSPEGV